MFLELTKKKKWMGGVCHVHSKQEPIVHNPRIDVIMAASRTEIELAPGQLCIPAILVVIVGLRHRSVQPHVSIKWQR